MDTILRKTLLIVLVLTMMVAFAPVTGTSAEFNMKCGTPDPPGGPNSTYARWMVNELEKRSGGRIAGKVFPMSQLGNNVQRVEQMQLGTLECDIGAVAFMSGAYPPVTVFDLPFIFPNDYDKVRKILSHGKATQWLSKDMERVRLKALAFIPTSFKVFTTTKKPITKLEDMKGIKFRSMASPILLAQFKALGANAIPIPFGEVYGALQSGLAEGQENPYWVLDRMKFFEVQKYVIESYHGVIVVHSSVSMKFWNSLPGDLKKILRDVVIEGEKVFTARVIETDNIAIAKLKKAGLKFLQLAPGERERFRKATEGVEQVFLKQIGAKGKELLDILKADIAKYGK